MELLKKFLKEEEGIGTVEIVLIGVVLIGLVLTFKGEIESLFTKIMSKISGDTNSILE